MNQTTIMGRLTTEPKFGITKGENPKKTVDFGFAVKSTYKDKKGGYHTNFINCTGYGQRAEFVEKYLIKGSFVAINGSLFTQNWEDEEKNKHYKTTVVVENFFFTYDTNKKDKDDTTETSQNVCGENNIDTE